MKHTITIACAMLLLAGCSNVRSQPANEDNNPTSQGEVMKIQFERSGGFAGMTTRVNIDTDSLLLPSRIRRQRVPTVSIIALRSTWMAASIPLKQRMEPHPLRSYCCSIG